MHLLARRGAISGRSNRQVLCPSGFVRYPEEAGLAPSWYQSRSGLKK